MYPAGHRLPGEYFPRSARSQKTAAARLHLKLAAGEWSQTLRARFQKATEAAMYSLSKAGYLYRTPEWVGQKVTTKM